MLKDENAHWQQLHFRDATIVDLHAHPSLKVMLFRRVLTQRFPATRYFDPLSVRTEFPKLQDAGLDVLLSSVYAPEHGLLDECRVLRLLRFVLPRTWYKVFGRPPLTVALDMMDRMELQVQRAGEAARMVRSVKELDDCLRQARPRPVAVIHNIEGSHVLEGRLESLDTLYQRGVAYMTLAHFYQNESVHPCFPFPESVQGFGCFTGDRNVALSLKPFGKEVVERMAELGIILDISHCTPPARREIYDIVGTRRPLLASHVGAYEINPSPYNLTDWEIRHIADTGGLVGVIFMNYWLMPHETHRGLNYIAYTIRHLVEVAGIDHVGIGTDFDGFTDPPDDLPTASELPKLTQRLIAEGYSDSDICKILGGNALRLLREGWGKKE